jgi:hypothetical protein
LFLQAHPKDAEFLNKHIDNYKEMETIFGNGLATGKFAMGSNENLGSPSDFADIDVKTEPFDEKEVKELKDVIKKEVKELKDVSSGLNKKKKRCTLTEEDQVVFSGMTEAVRDVVAAIRGTKVELVNPELYGAVMYMPGFSDEALIVAFSHLLDNKAQGDAFVNMTEAHRVLWLRTWLAKHYFL